MALEKLAEIGSSITNSISEGVSEFMDYKVMDLMGYEVQEVENYIPNMLESAMYMYARPIFEGIFDYFIQVFQQAGYDCNPRIPDLIISDKVKRAHLFKLPLVVEFDEEKNLKKLQHMLYVAEGTELPMKALNGKQKGNVSVIFQDKEIPMNLETMMKHAFAHEIFHYFSLTGDREMDELAAELNAQSFIMENCEHGDALNAIYWAQEMQQANMQGYEIKDVRTVRCPHKFSEYHLDFMQERLDYYLANEHRMKKEDTKFRTEKSKIPPLFLTDRFRQESPEHFKKLDGQRFLERKLTKQDKIVKEKKYPAGFIRYFQGEDPDITLNSWIKPENFL